MVVLLLTGSDGCVVDIVSVASVLSSMLTIVVNNDDFMSRYLLLNYGREKVLQNL